MIDIGNILRLAGDGYDAHDIRLFTRVPIPAIKQICKDAGVKLEAVTERAKPLVTVVKNSPKEAEARPKQANYPAQESAPAPKSKQNPLVVAKLWLGKRLVEKPSGYFLDGCPVNLTSIMRASNKAIKAEGGEQVAYHPGWLV